MSIGSGHHPFVLATAIYTGHFSAHLKSVTFPACTCSEIIFYMLKDAFYICVKLPLQFQKNAVQAASCLTCKLRELIYVLSPLVKPHVAKMTLVYVNDK